MITKLLAGGVAAAVVGITGATLHASAAPSPAPASTTSHHHHGVGVRRLALRAVHGDVVTRDKQGQFVTHRFVRGSVAAVSPTSIQVTAADRTSETFTVSTTTKVRIRSTVKGHGSKGSIADVHAGDDVVVVGVGSGTPAARWVVKLP
jgi:hypothetical protein